MRKQKAIADELYLRREIQLAALRGQTWHNPNEVALFEDHAMDKWGLGLHIAA